MGKRGPDKDDDAELWERVAQSATPLRKARTAKPPVPTVSRARPSAAIGRTPTSTSKLEAKLPKPPEARLPEKPVTKSLDRQVARKLDTGKLAVEARLDLHGMKQKEAHAALRRFLKSAQAKGRRHVLVITGKGADRSESRSFYEEEERGVLRQSVPHWLRQPDLAPLVVEFTAAPRRLGGEGALYVRLRRPK